MRLIIIPLLFLLATEGQARVSTGNSVVSAHLRPGSDLVEVSYKVVTSDYHCPLFAHGCTNRSISAHLYATTIAATGIDKVGLSSQQKVLLLEEKSDNAFRRPQWLNNILIQHAAGDMDTVEACQFKVPQQPCQASAHTASRRLEELIDAHHTDANGTLLFAADTLYSLPDLQVLANLRQQSGYQAFVTQLRETFDTGATYHDVAIVPVDENKLLGIPDYSMPTRYVLAYVYSLESDEYEPVAVDFSALTSRFGDRKMGLEIHDFARTDKGLVLFLEVILYSKEQSKDWKPSPRHFIVFDVATGRFSELPLTEFSVLDFHFLDVERSQLIYIDSHIKRDIVLKHYPFSF